MKGGHALEDIGIENVRMVLMTAGLKIEGTLKIEGS